MKILVTGYNGQLGYDVVKELNSRSVECRGVDREDFDITDRDETVGYICDYAPDAVIHCAAYTAVDRAEDDEENCRKVNADGTENIAVACEKLRAKMLYVSTDYVYGGDGEAPFETDSQTNPKNVYGVTKLEGEKAVMKYIDKFFIVRTSWVFGINGNNFVKTMLRLGDEKESLNVVCDQVGSPTYTPDLARLICDLIVTEKYGIYHVTNENYCSWAEFAAEIMKLGGKKTVINPVPSSEYPTKAERPHNSRLSKKCLDEAGIKRLPTWQDALKRFLKEMSG
ncbi:MAG: dTDP-4-dehydrorhamnose reductase [Clostridiaceae bacterium]|nr:dTDP-4-dehydrorhamnose reductase [Clostridiaceae bacterium]MDY5890007.1 dTDP-4-dehydrorhamnose reductase [Oscillospiraceae bacterium]